MQADKAISWDDFAKWLSSKLSPVSESKPEFSKEYNVQYKNWFQKDWSTDESIIKIGNTSIKRSKIQEATNYVEKIRSIQSTEQNKTKSVPEKPKPPISQTPVVPKQETKEPQKSEPKGIGPKNKENTSISLT